MPLVLLVAVQLACVLVDIVGNHQEVVHDVLLGGQDVSQGKLREGQGVAEHGHEEVVDLSPGSSEVRIVVIHTLRETLLKSIHRLIIVCIY